MPVIKTERGREAESEKSPPRRMATPQSLLLHSPLGILGMHARVPGVSFKPPGLVHEPWSRESSDIAITLTAGFLFFFLKRFIAIGHMRSPERQRETERQKARNHPPGGWPHRSPLSIPFLGS